MANAALFAERDLEAAFGQFQRRRDADDTAADDHHINAVGKVFVALHGHYARSRHQ